jgi:hypothetical protein
MMGQSSVVIPSKVSTGGTGIISDDLNVKVSGLEVNECGEVPKESAAITSKKLKAYILLALCLRDRKID